MEKLALFGGPKAVTLDDSEALRWPIITNEEIEAVNELMRKGEVSVSPIVKEFEQEFADYCGAKYALAQNNGTSTLHAAYFAVGISPGDEVITPVYSWHLQLMPILAAHGVPVFCDIDPKTLNIDPEDIERKITPRTKAIVVVHVYGHPAEMDDILAIAKQHKLAVVEDCSHAHGAEYKGRKVGTFGDVGCFSLQGSKLMVAGEGGILVTNNTKYYERAIMLGHYERIPSLTLPDYTKYQWMGKEVPPICFGYKYRIHPLGAAIARVQLKHLDERNDIRRKNLEYLSQGLKDIKGVDPPYIA
ncbi:MAG: DegT/DnrJ/EryC1/StrS family aminotransferase, partial [Thermodesulfobacteriota bacterium]